MIKSIIVLLVALGVFEHVTGLDLLERCKQFTGAKSQELVGIFVADPGEFSQTSEAHFYLDNTDDMRSMRKYTVCASVKTGTMMGQKILLVTTGIGYMAAVACVQDMLSQCGPLIKDIIYTGTSGWSAARGGILNVGTCKNGSANTAGQITRLGDVCVSPLAVNGHCRQASYDMDCSGFPNQCSLPKENHGPADRNLFGQCQFTNVTKKQFSLADEILDNIRSKGQEVFPRRNAKLQQDEAQYWELMRLQSINDEKTNFPETSPKAAPKVWDYKQCMEVSTYTFWSGVPWDMNARQYVAETLNTAFKSKEFNKENVLVVSAMEGVGLGQAMYNYFKMTGRRIPFTSIRGMSNVVHQPVMFDPEAGMWFTSGVVKEDFVEGYKYAIATTSTTVMTTLKARCMKLAKEGKVSASECSFEVKYP